MKQQRNKKKTKPSPIVTNLTRYLYIAGFIAIVSTIYIGYRAAVSDRKLFSIGLIALFAGVLFESARIAENWKKVAAIFAGSYVFSLLSFLPGKREHVYNFENHIQVWPYAFLFIFAIIFVVTYKEKVTARLNEGITLLLSTSLVYWAIDYGWTEYRNWFSLSLMTIGTAFTIFSLTHALTHIPLSRGNRLLLSIWSTIITVAFSVDNIIRVFSNPDIESSGYLSDGLYIGVQYFLLGISAVYIMQNYFLLVAFLPSRNGNYKRELKEAKKEHIDRYSDRQVNTGQALFCLVFTAAVYGLNHHYQLLPRHTMIFLVIFSFPFIIGVIPSFRQQRPG